MKRFYDGNLDLATLNDTLNSRGYPNANIVNKVDAAQLNALGPRYPFTDGDFENADKMNSAFVPPGLLDDFAAQTYGTTDTQGNFAYSGYAGPNVFTRATQKYVFDSSGFLVPVAAGTPAFAYDPVTGAPLGQSIESAATNHQSHNDDLTLLNNSIYFSTTAVQSIFASGSVAAKYTRTATGVAPLSNSGSFVSDGSVSTAWAIVELQPNNKVRVSLRDVEGSVFAAATVYSLSAAPIESANGSGSTPATYKYTNLGPGPNGGTLVQIEATADVVSGNTAAILIYPDTTSTIGNSLTLHFAQLENQSFASSPILTGNRSKTRADDNLTAPLSNIGYNPNEGTLIVDFGPGAFLTTGTAAPPYYCSLGFVGPNGLADGQIELATRGVSGGSLDFLVRAANNTALQYTNISPDFTAGGKVAFRFLNNGADQRQSASIGGAIKNLPSNVDMSTALSSMTMLYANSLMNVTIKTLQMVPYYMNDSDFMGATA